MLFPGLVDVFLVVLFVDVFLVVLFDDLLNCGAALARFC